MKNMIVEIGDSRIYHSFRNVLFLILFFYIPKQYLTCQEVTDSIMANVYTMSLEELLDTIPDL